MAFQLSDQDPVSDVVQAVDGFYVLHLVKVTPARQLSLDEAKPKIVEAVTASRAREMAWNKGAQVSHDLRETLASGAPLSVALEKAA